MPNGTYRGVKGTYNESKSENYPVFRADCFALNFSGVELAFFLPFAYFCDMLEFLKCWMFVRL